MTQTPNTRASLLLGLRDNDDDSWSRFFDLYAPVIYRFARARGLTDDQAEEVRDECLELLARKLPGFEYDPSRGRFRGWLFQIVSGRVVDASRRRSPRRIDTADLRLLRDPLPSPAEAWERTWRMEHLRYAFSRARLRVTERDYTAFSMLLEDDCSVGEVEQALGMNRNQVYKAKSRVLAEVRRILTTLGA